MRASGTRVIALSAAIGASSRNFRQISRRMSGLDTVSIPARVASATRRVSRALTPPSSSPTVRRFSALCRMTPGAVISPLIMTTAPMTCRAP